MLQALTPAGLLLATAAVVTVCFAASLFAASPTVGVSALAAGQAWQVVTRGQVPVLDAGISLYPLDILAVCAALAAAISLVRRPVKAHLGHAALAVLALLVSVSLLTGMEAYGFQPAGNEARVYFLHVLAVVSYIATVGRGASLERTMLVTWIVLACVYSVTAVYWWSRLGIGSNSDYAVIDGSRVNARPIDAASAFVVAEAAVMLLCRPRRGPGGRTMIVFLLLVVVLLQHRTVWIAALVMLSGWLVLRPGPPERKVLGVGAALLAAVTMGLAALLFENDGLTRHLASSATNEDTWQWRVDSWRLLVDKLSGFHDWLFGQPFGSGFARFLYTGVVDVQPHNYYLHLVLRVGVVGLCAALVLVITMLRRTDRRTPEGLTLWLATAGIACFCLTYALPFEQSLLIGLLLRQPAASRGAPRGRRHRTAEDHHAHRIHRADLTCSAEGPSRL
ncbi:O-antigen ligase family protein [Streptacidiphilus rugosus]|uniref:O-antigen ligase family protein n=1 Tax=Streptacidiphilus rugosus TaxID=405783 RepID=UPI00056A7F85|nr:O-antigen ligase family protein [Streptacidiphilus rugosus]